MGLLKESIQRAFALGCTISLQRDMRQCYIEVSHPKTINIRGQYISIDDHLDYAIPGCLDTCIKQLLMDIDAKKVE